MAQPWVAGPANIFVGIGSSINSGGQQATGFAPVFLGHAEITPQLRHVQEWDDLFCSIGGTKIPFDRIYEGEHAFIRVDFTRWNEPVMQSIMARPFTQAAGSFLGTSIPGDLGTLMLLEGGCYPLWIQLPYAIKPAYTGMPGAYHYFSTYLMGPDELGPLNADARRPTLIWHAIRSYTVGSITVAGQGSSPGNPSPPLNIGSAFFELYDFNQAGLPVIN